MSIDAATAGVHNFRDRAAISVIVMPPTRAGADFLQAGAGAIIVRLQAHGGARMISIVWRALRSGLATKVNFDLPAVNSFKTPPLRRA